LENFTNASTKDADSPSSLHSGIPSLTERYLSFPRRRESIAPKEDYVESNERFYYPNSRWIPACAGMT
jgi:hypothetical protein